jgi:hypothetical protein
MTKPDGERIAAMEQKMIDVSAQLTEVALDVKDIKEKLSFKLADHREFEDRLKRLEQKEGLWRWLSPTLAAVFGSIGTFLIIEYFKTH